MMRLPLSDREQLMRECVEVLSSPESMDRFDAFSVLLEDWRNTAERYAEPALASSLAAPIDEPLRIAVS
ncbi:hypothetical protein JCM13591A_20290 [Microbacterium xylanilyticum]